MLKEEEALNAKETKIDEVNHELDTEKKKKKEKEEE